MLEHILKKEWPSQARDPEKPMENLLDKFEHTNWGTSSRKVKSGHKEVSFAESNKKESYGELLSFTPWRNMVQRERERE